MTDTPPAILTSKEHRICHVRWHDWREAFPDRVILAKRIFGIAERSVLAFGPHLTDHRWLSVDPHEMHEDVYGPYDPVDTLLEVMHFPDHSPPIVDRGAYVAKVKSMIREHEQHGSDGLYMPRSVILGWIAWQHDLILSDVKEVA